MGLQGHLKCSDIDILEKTFRLQIDPWIWMWFWADLEFGHGWWSDASLWVSECVLCNVSCTVLTPCH